MLRPAKRLFLFFAVVLALTTGVAAPGAAEVADGELTGRFTTAAGLPIDRAAVRAYASYPANPVASTFSGPDGGYRLALPAGEYLLEFFNPRGARQWSPGQLDAETATRYVVTAGGATVVDEVAIPTGQLDAKVLDTDGTTPVRNSTVTVYRDDGQHMISAPTDERGNTISLRLPAGQYRVGVTLPDTAVEQFVPGKLARVDGALHTVLADQSTVVTERLLPHGTVTATLLATDGQPLSGASLALNGPGPRHGGYGRADAAGVVRLATFAGEWTGTVTTTDHRRTQYIPGGKWLEDAAPIRVDAGADTALTERLLPLGSVRVTATDATSGAALADFCAGTDWQRVCSNGTGQVLLTDVVAGRTHVNVTADEPRYLAGATEITTVGDTTVQATVALVRGTVVTTVVRAADTGAPLAGACVAMVSPAYPLTSSDSFLNCSDNSGRVAVGFLEPGNYRMLVRAPHGSGYGAQWVGRTGGTGDMFAARLVKAVAQTVTEVPEIRLDRAGAVTGRVTRADGSVPGYGVVALTTTHPGIGSPGTDVPVDPADGTYTIDGLGPYEWPLHFSATAEADQWSGGTPNRLSAKKIKVTAGATTHYDHRMRGSATVTGTSSASSDHFVTLYSVLTGEVVGSGWSRNGRYAVLVTGPQVVRFDSGRAVLVPRRGTVTVNV